LLNQVLIIDDSEEIHYIINRHLKKKQLSHHSVSVFDGEEALGLLKDQLDQGNDKLPELILLDINMPGMNGLEFLIEFQKLLNTHHSLEVIKCFIITSSKNSKDLEQISNFSFVKKYIVKPIDSNEFAQNIKEIFLELF
jgi:CheY-like chemotaxis protein